jgi:hypothetical protein
VHFNCRIVHLIVGGGDTAHGALPRLVATPTGDNFKKNHEDYQWLFD